MRLFVSALLVSLSLIAALASADSGGKRYPQKAGPYLEDGRYFTRQEGPTMEDGSYAHPYGVQQALAGATSAPVAKPGNGTQPERSISSETH